MKWYHWIWAGLVVVIVILAWLFSRKNEALADIVNLELELIDTKARTKRLQAELGNEAAKSFVMERYKEEIERLDEEQKKAIDALSNDPIALADFATRVARQ